MAARMLWPNNSQASGWRGLKSKALELKEWRSHSLALEPVIGNAPELRGC